MKAARAAAAATCRRCALLAVIALVASCGGGDQPPQPVAARPYEDPGFVRGAGYEMRYGVLRASALDADVARGYGIVRSERRAVVTVAVLRQRPGAMPVTVEAEVDGVWRRLTGEAFPLGFRRVLDGQAVSYVAEFDVRDREPVVLELEAQPSGSSAKLHARITREFAAG